jgi:HD-like signal output (HDOD) protein
MRLLTSKGYRPVSIPTTPYAMIQREIEEMLDTNTLKLPSMPEIITKINDTINDPKSHMTDIAKIIQMDGAVTARLLRIVNSPALRGSKEIETVFDAVSRLGINTVKSIIMAVKIREQFSSSSNVILKNVLEKVWERSVTIAIFSFHICKKHTHLGLTPDIALTRGLLFYIGALPIIDYFERHNSNISEPHVSETIEQLRQDITNKVLKHWGLVFESDEFQNNVSTYKDVIKAIHRVLTAQAVNPSEIALKSAVKTIAFESLLSMIFSVDEEILEIKRKLLS